jgi:hypothetical protein
MANPLNKPNRTKGRAMGKVKLALIAIAAVGTAISKAIDWWRTPKVTPPQLVDETKPIVEEKET